MSAPPNQPAPPHRADAIVTFSSISAPVRRSTVPARTVYGDYREELRWDFWFHCAYCTLAEYEARGIRFTIDHYLPEHRYPELASAYSNLMWACDTCNIFKGTHPSESASLKGRRFLRPDSDDPDEHVVLSLKSPQRVEHLTMEVGEYTIEILYLNREPLRRLRAARERLAASADVIRKGLRALRGKSVQDLPPKARAVFIEVRDKLTRKGIAASALVDDTLVREANRSELIDPPPTCDQDASQRRRFLRNINSPIAVTKTT